ncbi:unnamed protein product [Acanthosepion pharaonis]|uniref:Uncharacterized protein n=1 Tax=Acanthosepion pharaonis TaxID=158019 RepID=A0A812DV35_ACAPH|nr:unnamed protein product [Sepia pharaonis]
MLTFFLYVLSFHLAQQIGSFFLSVTFTFSFLPFLKLVFSTLSSHFCIDNHSLFRFLSLFQSLRHILYFLLPLSLYILFFSLTLSIPPFPTLSYFILFSLNPLPAFIFSDFIFPERNLQMASSSLRNEIKEAKKRLVDLQEDVEDFEKRLRERIERTRKSIKQLSIDCELNSSKVWKDFDALREEARMKAEELCNQMRRKMTEKQSKWRQSLEEKEELLEEAEKWLIDLRHLLGDCNVDEDIVCDVEPLRAKLSWRHHKSFAPVEEGHFVVTFPEWCQRSLDQIQQEMVDFNVERCPPQGNWNLKANSASRIRTWGGFIRLPQRRRRSREYGDILVRIHLRKNSLSLCLSLPLSLPLSPSSVSLFPSPLPPSLSLPRLFCDYKGAEREKNASLSIKAHPSRAEICGSAISLNTMCIYLLAVCLHTSLSLSLSPSLSLSLSLSL